MSRAVGVCLAAFADLPLPDALARVRGLGLDLVDLPTDSLFRVRPDVSFAPPAGPTGVTALRELLDRAGVRIACVSNSRDAQLILGPHGTHTDRVVAGDPDAKRAHGRRHALDTIRLAGALEVPLVRLMLGCPDFGRWLTWSGSSVSWDDNVDLFVAEAAPLAAAAVQEGVTLIIEPHAKQVPYDLASTRACLDGLEAAGFRAGICFDPANVAALRHDPVEFLVALVAETGSAPLCVHAKDIELATSVYPPEGPGWISYGPQPALRFRSVPYGELDWNELLATLAVVGFDGPILIEHEDLVTDRASGIAAAAEHVSGVPVDLRDPAFAASRNSVPAADPAPATTPWW